MTQPSTSSGSIAVTAGASVIPAGASASQVRSGILKYVSATGGSAAGTVRVYDGSSTAGVLLIEVAGVPIGLTQTVELSDGVAFAGGLFIVVAGAGSTAVCHYILGD